MVMLLLLLLLLVPRLLVVLRRDSCCHELHMSLALSYSVRLAAAPTSHLKSFKKNQLSTLIAEGCTVGPRLLVVLRRDSCCHELHMSLALSYSVLQSFKFQLRSRAAVRSPKPGGGCAAGQARAGTWEAAQEQARDGFPPEGRSLASARAVRQGVRDRRAGAAAAARRRRRRWGRAARRGAARARRLLGRCRHRARG
jgi:hypothetical protein